MKKMLAIGIGIAIIAIIIGVVAYTGNNVTESKNTGESSTNVISKGKNYSVTLTENLGVQDKGP